MTGERGPGLEKMRHSVRHFMLKQPRALILRAEESRGKSGVAVAVLASRPGTVAQFVELMYDRCALRSGSFGLPQRP